MSINPLMRSSPPRLMGLSSGMDTESIIQATLRMHQFKIDNQMRSRKLIEWKQQIHNGIKDQITSLRQTYLSTLGSKSLMNRNAFSAIVASVSGANSGAVSIRTNAGSPTGNFSINSVTQLAKGMSLNTTAGVSQSGNGFAPTTRLSDMVFEGSEKIEWTQQGAALRMGNQDVKIEYVNNTWEFRNSAGDLLADTTGNTATVTAGGVTRTFNLHTDGSTYFNVTEDRAGVFSGTVTGMDDGGNPIDINITAAYASDTWTFSVGAGMSATLDGDELVIMRGDEELYREVWDGDTKTAGGVAFNQVEQHVTSLSGEAYLEINGASPIIIRAVDSINDVISRVNNSNAGVTMSYNRLTDQFSIEAKTGAGVNPETTNLALSSDSNFFNLISGSTGALSYNAGQQAEVTINGITQTFNTNTFDYRGVTVTLNETFNDGNAVSVNLTRDTSMAVDAIKDFINSYNTIIKRLEDLLNERKTGNESSYKPLTDEEKSMMSEKQIEEWEAIAKKGILRNDRGIQDLASNLRRSFFEQIEGVGLSASQIGLTTGSYFDGTGGQIMIDEEKLRAAIEEDPDRVADIFIRIDSTGSTPRGEGLLYKIDGLMRDFVNTTQSNSLTALEDSLRRANEQIMKMEERMWAEEEKLYRQFAAMETALSRMTQQGDWFNAMLGGS